MIFTSTPRALAASRAFSTSGCVRWNIVMRIDFRAEAMASTTGWRPESDGVTKKERMAGPGAVAVAGMVSVVGRHAATARSSMLARMPIALDGTKPVRKGEELDVVALARFLEVA